MRNIQLTTLCDTKKKRHQQTIIIPLNGLLAHETIYKHYMVTNCVKRSLSMIKRTCRLSCTVRRTPGVGAHATYAGLRHAWIGTARTRRLLVARFRK